MGLLLFPKHTSFSRTEKIQRLDLLIDVFLMTPASDPGTSHMSLVASAPESPLSRQLLSGGVDLGAGMSLQLDWGATLAWGRILPCL